MVSLSFQHQLKSSLLPYKKQGESYFDEESMFKVGIYEAIITYCHESEHSVFNKNSFINRCVFKLV